mmetsp:Transcript_39733/g.119436  ORF Transcript_39733/g.119436 Transcript_39733/m.119436 type:complete len:203 (+) Transcript_39733:1690-2298(+)
MGSRSMPLVQCDVDRVLDRDGDTANFPRMEPASGSGQDGDGAGPIRRVRHQDERRREHRRGWQHRRRGSGRRESLLRRHRWLRRRAVLVPSTLPWPLPPVTDPRRWRPSCHQPHPRRQGQRRRRRGPNQPQRPRINHLLHPRPHLLLRRWFGRDTRHGVLHRLRQPGTHGAGRGQRGGRQRYRVIAARRSDHSVHRGSNDEL